MFPDEIIFVYNKRFPLNIDVTTGVNDKSIVGFPETPSPFVTEILDDPAVNVLSEYVFVAVLEIIPVLDNADKAYKSLSNVNVIVPELVIGDPEIDKPVEPEIAIEVTVPS